MLATIQRDDGSRSVKAGPRAIARPITSSRSALALPRDAARYISLLSAITSGSGKYVAMMRPSVVCVHEMMLGAERSCGLPYLASYAPSVSRVKLEDRLACNIGVTQPVMTYTRDSDLLAHLSPNRTWDLQDDIQGPASIGLGASFGAGVNDWRTFVLSSSWA